MFNHLRSFLRSPGGNVAILFGLTLAPILGLFGAAIDYSRAMNTRTQLQVAVDATVLAVNRQIGKMSAEELEAYALSYLLANARGLAVRVEGVSIDAEEHVVTIDVKATTETSILHILHIDEIDVGVSATSMVGAQTFEIALVLDNSGSMAGNRIRDLRDASQSLVDMLFEGMAEHPHVNIGIVPFAAAVNVGAHNRTAAWMDRNAVSPVHSQGFTSSVNRFALFDTIRNASWGGCVEARPAPYDVLDTPASPSTPATMFVPMFAPDEPDNNTTYLNRYLTDNGGSCNINSNTLRNMSQQERLGLACKYTNATADVSLAYGSRLGPNFLCDSAAITPLTNRRSTLSNAISAMVAYGGTNIHEGLMWGWRVLSPQAPFTEAVPPETEHNLKFLILMSDGANHHIPRSNDMWSIYSSYGYSRFNRLGNNLRTESQLIGGMNARTLLACQNIKAAGIQVYTIAFDINDAATMQLLQTCASGTRMAYTVDRSDQLVDVFETIAKQVSRLRVAR